MSDHERPGAGREPDFVEPIHGRGSVRYEHDESNMDGQFDLKMGQHMEFYQSVRKSNP